MLRTGIAPLVTAAAIICALTLQTGTSHVPQLSKTKNTFNIKVQDIGYQVRSTVKRKRHSEITTIEEPEEIIEAKNSIKSNFSAADLRCLAENIYWEAANQSFAGKLAVAFVTLNRVRDPSFPSSICQVVHQKTRHADSGNIICQFSWVCEQKTRRPAKEAWEESIVAAKLVLDEDKGLHDLTNGAKFFHTTYVAPSWKRTKRKTVLIDDHIFYK